MPSALTRLESLTQALNAVRLDHRDDVYWAARIAPLADWPTRRARRQRRHPRGRRIDCGPR